MYYNCLITFGLGVDLNNIATTGFITIGAIVKF